MMVSSLPKGFPYSISRECLYQLVWCALALGGEAWKLHAPEGRWHGEGLATWGDLSSVEEQHCPQGSAQGACRPSRASRYRRRFATSPSQIYSDRVILPMRLNFRRSWLPSFPDRAERSR